jgi:hypothetical protein
VIRAWLNLPFFSFVLACIGVTTLWRCNPRFSWTQFMANIHAISHPTTAVLTTQRKAVSRIFSADAPANLELVAQITALNLLVYPPLPFAFHSWKWKRLHILCAPPHESGRDLTDAIYIFSLLKLRPWIRFTGSYSIMRHSNLPESIGNQRQTFEKKKSSSALFGSRICKPLHEYDLYAYHCLKPWERKKEGNFIRGLIELTCKKEG